MLRYHHNAVNESGFSPFQILFGRDRPEAGLPYEPPAKCPSAQTFFDRMQEVDEVVAHNFEVVHQAVQAQVNAKRRPRAPFKEGDKVWVLRPRSVGGNKLETWWLGPAKVVQRVGASSYQVIHKPGEIWDVHMDSLKAYVEDDLMGTSVPLYFHKGTTKSTVLGDTEEEVQCIRKHRLKDGVMEFLTLWKGAASAEETWEPASTFVQSFSPVWLEYLVNHKLETNLAKFLGGEREGDPDMVERVRTGSVNLIGPTPRERYAVRKPVMTYILERLQLETPTVDAFADHELFMCPRWWGPGSEVEDAFTQDWGKERLLWINPPFSLL